MSEPLSKSTDDVKPVRQRPAWERTLVWGGILVLLVVVFMEWHARQSYTATLNTLEDMLTGGKTIPLQDLHSHLRGGPARSESTTAGAKVVTLRWATLFREYKLSLPVRSGDILFAVETSVGDTDVAGPRNRPPQKVIPSPQARSEIFPGRLPPGYERVMALRLESRRSLNDLNGLMAREIVRQGLLIAAEEELHLTTLDPSIGESIPTGDGPTGPLTVRIAAPFRAPSVRNSGQGPDGQYVVSVLLHRRTESDDLNWIAPDVKLPSANWLEPLVEEIESCSRSTYVDGLTSVGFERATIAKGTPTSSALPEDHLDIASQYALIRHFHLRRLGEGETAETLGRLVRAYANLGNLTDFHWGASSKAFKARSLLYARRLASKFPENPASLAHQAYAQALAGRHAAALGSCHAATDAVRATGSPAPDWLELIEAYCAYDTQTLDLEDGRNRELAAYLRMRMAHLYDDPEGSLQAIKRMAELNPACSRVIESLSEMAELGIQRMASEVSTQPMWMEMNRRLVRIPGLPGDAKANLASREKNRRPNLQSDIKSRVEFASLLNTATGLKDHAGPSWSVLADLVNQTSFVQLVRLLELEENALGVSTEETLRLYQPLIQGHRHQKFLESYVTDPVRASALIGEYHSTVDLKIVDPAMMIVYAELLAKRGEAEGYRFAEEVARNADPILEDALLQLAARQFNTHDTIPISPKWPMSISVAIYKADESQLKQWEQENSDSSIVLLALYRQYIKLEKNDHAQRCLEKVIEIAPSSKTYTALAHLQKEKGNRDKWREYLEKALEFPSHGLESAQVHHELAEDACDRKDWEAARPHALAAAQSYSGWGLYSAMRVFEGLKQWDEAEKYVRACSERYPNESSAWYFWCIRTGHGDIEEAKELAESYWASPEFSADFANDPWELVAARVVNGQFAEARMALIARQKQGDMNSTAFIANLADEQGETGERDKIFRQMEPNWVAEVGFVELTNLFRGVLSGKEEGRWNRNAFEQILINSEVPLTAYIYLQAGLFLRRHGEPELADEYLQYAATASPSDWASLIAIDALRKRKVMINETRATRLPQSLIGVSGLLLQAKTAQAEGQLEEAESLLTQAIKVRPDFATSFIKRGRLRQSQEKYGEALADFEEAYRLDPNFADACLSLSWLLSTAPPDELRDGKRALGLAEKALRLRQFETALNAATLAAAHAECGDIPKALELESRARQLPGHKDHNQLALAAYKAGRPFRQFKRQ